MPGAAGSGTAPARRHQVTNAAQSLAYSRSVSGAGECRSGGAASGTQPLCFIDHATHDMRIGYYRDTYLRTADGWRLKTRAMTFIRRSGVHDSGRPHAIGRPTP